MDRYERRVRRGAALLDRRVARHPGSAIRNWRNKIDLTRLDLLHEKDCILGQLYGNFFEAPGIGREHTWFNLMRGFVAPLHWWDPGLLPGSLKRHGNRVKRLTEAWRAYLISERVKNSETVLR